jgi:flavin-dependent dehydrogenase
MDFDPLVIGSDPGDQRAAIQAAKLGKRAAIIERREITRAPVVCPPSHIRRRSPACVQSEDWFISFPTGMLMMGSLHGDHTLRN